MTHKIRPIISDLTDKEKNTVIFAAEELQKYLTKVSYEDFSVIPVKEYGDDADSIYLGVAMSSEIPVVDNTEFDDAILINVDSFSGMITGTNARSVLIAVYRYLKELGFAFLKPGENGEFYPDKLTDKEVFVCEKASYRHRTICIEGSVFQKCITDTIDWIPKAAMNGYFMQFFIPQEFLNRWYKYDMPYKKSSPLTEDDMYAILKLAEKEIEKRSLIYHAAGHGWTGNALGVKMSSWGTYKGELKNADLIALVDGKRELREGRPTNTELCYSNPKAREAINNCVIEHCKNNPNISYLHFWLSDDSNNKCECEACQQKQFTDWYIMTLNELDQKLTAEGIKTKIGVAVYSDTFWKALNERFKNNDRFLLLFAPIYRTYSSSFDGKVKGNMEPYVLNKFVYPTKIEDNLEFLRDWQKDFDCDIVDFDYHFMWDLYIDFSQYNHGKILSEDIKELKNIGINGMIACKVQRTYLPTALGVNVMAETLWNRETDFETFSDKLLKIEFGKSYSEVKKYLSSLSVYGCPKAFRGEEAFDTNNNIENIQKAIDIIDSFQPVIQNELTENYDKNLVTWNNLKFFSELYKMVLEFALKSVNDGEVADYSHISDYVYKSEELLKNEFDAMYFMRTFENRILRAIKNDKKVYIGNE